MGVLLTIACSDGSTDEDETSDKCCELGAACHVVGGSTDQEVTDCHEIGHQNDLDTCDAEYDRCIQVCDGVNDEPMEHACE
jgi:hypothetical protein